MEWCRLGTAFGGGCYGEGNYNTSQATEIDYKCGWLLRIWSQVGPMCHLVGRCKRTDYTSPQQMDLIFFGYLIHNSPPKHHVLNLYGASIPE
eukprot:911487-Amorphochlora_amoeboformis.AAC.1